MSLNLPVYEETRAERTYVLEIAFSQSEYNQLVNTVIKKTKKSLTGFAKDAILDKGIKTSKGEWKLYTS